jgi:hypothetical protein
MHGITSEEGHKKECLRMRDVNAYVERWWARAESLRALTDAETKATIEHERFSVRDFLINHPCPPMDWTLNWVKDGGRCPGHGLTLPCLKGTKFEEPNLKGTLLDHGLHDHEYPRFSQFI